MDDLVQMEENILVILCKWERILAIFFLFNGASFVFITNGCILLKGNDSPINFYVNHSMKPNNFACGVD